MNKTMLLSVLLCLGSFSLSAQAGHKFWGRAQGGYAVCGTGDRDGSSWNFTGGKYFTSRFKLGAGLTYALFDNGVHSPVSENYARAASFEITGFYDLFRTEYFKLEIGLGPNVQAWDWTYRAEPNTTIVLVDDDIRILPNQRVQYDQTQLGYTGSIGVVFTPNAQLEMGVWGVHQNGLKNDNISSLRAGIGFKL
jgi:hypothetical protein